MPVDHPPQDLVEQIRSVADEQVRDVFKRMGTLKAEAIARKIEYLLNHDDWRANVEGIKLRARIAGDYAAEEVKVTPQRAEDLGGMDDVLSQLPEAVLLAIAMRTKVRGQLEE